MSTPISLNFILLLLYYHYISISCKIFWIHECSTSKFSIKMILVQGWNKGTWVLSRGLIFFMHHYIVRLTSIFFLWSWKQNKRTVIFTTNGATCWMSARLYNSKPFILMNPHDIPVSVGFWFHLQMIRIIIMYTVMWLFKSYQCICFFFFKYKCAFSETRLSSVFGIQARIPVPFNEYWILNIVMLQLCSSTVHYVSLRLMEKWRKSNLITFNKLFFSPESITRKYLFLELANTYIPDTLVLWTSHRNYIL